LPESAESSAPSATFALARKKAVALDFRGNPHPAFSDGFGSLDTRLAAHAHRLAASDFRGQCEQEVQG
jgi:hypothetical protein